jgi:hypothetical protein
LDGCLLRIGCCAAFVGGVVVQLWVCLVQLLWGGVFQLLGVVVVAAAWVGCVWFSSCGVWLLQLLGGGLVVQLLGVVVAAAVWDPRFGVSLAWGALASFGGHRNNSSPCREC